MSEFVHLFFIEPSAMDFLYRVEMYLPLKDKDGQMVDPQKFDEVAEEIVKQFGGLTTTSFRGNPVYDGFWKSPKTKKIVKDKNSVFTVLIPQNEESRNFFLCRKKKWEEGLNYEQLLITIHQVQIL